MMKNYTMYTPLYVILYTLRSPTSVKPPINSPTTSAQSDSTGLSFDESDEEVGFYSDDDDFNDDDDIDDEEKLWGASTSVNEEDNITYESLV